MKERNPAGEVRRRGGWRRRAVGAGGIVCALITLATRPGAAQHPRWEASLWAGLTTITGAEPEWADGDDPGVGIRFAEVAIWYTPELRVWVQYDNGLTLDNSTLRRERLDAPSLYTGGLYHWAGRFTTRLEGGWREVDGVGQRLFRSEQVAFLARSLALRGGAWVAAGGEGEAELLFHGGLTWIVSRHLHIDPTFFYSPGRDSSGVSQSRGLLFAEYQSAEGWKIGLGAAGGVVASGAGAIDGGRERVLDGFLLFAAPIKGGHEARLLFRREEVGDLRSLSTLSVGLTFRPGGQ